MFLKWYTPESMPVSRQMKIVMGSSPSWQTLPCSEDPQGLEQGIKNAIHI